MYITYNINTRQIERIDSELIVIDDDNLKIIEKEIAFEDDICVNMSIYKVDNNEKFYIDEELVAINELNKLRVKRQPLLKAFDVYKTNLIVGVISLSEEEKKQVANWYNLVLDLNEGAIKNPPDVILKYIQ